MTTKLEALSITLHKVMGDCMTMIQDLTQEEKQTLGRNAIDLICDYPLYASSSNITYDEAIMIAITLGFTTKELMTGEVVE